MPSPAHVDWTTSRASRLDELVAAHAVVGGEGPGRRWRTQQLNHALALALAAEFQGFARDLHTLTASVFSEWACGGNNAAQTQVATVLTLNRQLDRGNAHPGSIGSDFDRFGLLFWPALRARESRTISRQDQLERLNNARNAIVHSLPGNLAALASQGYPINLRTVAVWRRALNALASTMDDTVARHLATVFGRPEPW